MDGSDDFSSSKSLHKRNLLPALININFKTTKRVIMNIFIAVVEGFVVGN